MQIPEDRLLNLIKAKNRKPQEPLRVDGAAPVKNLPTLENVLSKNKIFQHRHMVYLSFFLTFLLAISLVYFAIIMLVPYDKRHYNNKDTDRSALPSEIGDEQPLKAGVPDAKGYSDYYKDIGSKKLFSSESDQGISGEEQAAGLEDRFSLVGIVTGDNPQAIIEDKKAGKTYYLFRGAGFSGAVVESIENGKVIINYKGEKINLVL